jgi:hypothetical protein
VAVVVALGLNYEKEIMGLFENVGLGKPEL